MLAVRVSSYRQRFFQPCDETAIRPVTMIDDEIDRPLTVAIGSWSTFRINHQAEMARFARARGDRHVETRRS